MRPLIFFPITFVLVVGSFLLLAFLFVLIQVGLISYAYERLGLSAELIFPLLVLSLLGSSFNIPITRVESGEVVSERVVDFFGVRYVIPTCERHQPTVIAINLGGAVIPVCISLYLLFHSGLVGRGLLGIAIVSAIVHRYARPVPGLGIAIPIFIPPLIAAATGILLAPEQAPALAYIAGTLGCLIGADILNIPKLAGLGAPIASIGGAGTFDGIFFTGILAVLLT
ncbi:MAG: DUF1614 domain-containing protein [Deltaproteobacteria bacterium]|nr:DUF1614 domain-containing protein [Deltaproteobacteria bacterium]